MDISELRCYDEFTGKIRISPAHRANHKCSRCKLPMSGPSDESPEANVNIDVAAHLCAASPGGPRYLATMTSKETFKHYERDMAVSESRRPH
jgi:hypothetical protein